jgi:hypothetical protein
MKHWWHDSTKDLTPEEWLQKYIGPLGFLRWVFAAPVRGGLFAFCAGLLLVFLIGLVVTVIGATP